MTKVFRLLNSTTVSRPIVFLAGNLNHDAMI